MGAADYSKLIDVETWAFIRATESWYPPETATFSVEKQREIYDAMCRAFHRGYPKGVTARDERFGGVPCRVYEGPSMVATVVYEHGGGFVVGGLHSHDDVCAEICKDAGVRVVAVDYRLAPEHRHPAHFDDALAATKAVAATYGEPIVLAGDSAGGALTASVAHALRGSGIDIRGQVLIYPGLGGDRDKGSYLTHANAPMLTRDDVLYYATVRYPDDMEPLGDATAAALQDIDFSGLPPTLIFVAECDPLCDDGGHYAAEIVAAGGKARNRVEQGLVHGYLRGRKTVSRAAASFARITQGITALARGEWPEEV